MSATTKEPFSVLDVLLHLRLALCLNGDASPVKTLQRQAKKMIPLTTTATAATTIIPIMGSRDPILTLEQRENLWFTLKNTHEEFVANGFHGMIIHDNVIHSVQLDLEDRGDLDHAIENELNLFGATGQAFADTHGLNGFDGHIMFFPEYGFSGEMKAVKCRRSQSRGQSSIMKLFSAGTANSDIRKKKR